MDTTAVCRTCLTSNTRIIVVRGGQLLHLFEKLVAREQSTGQLALCYICYSQLMKCVRFVDMAQRADFMLKAARAAESGAPLQSTTSFIRTPPQSVCVPLWGAAGGTLAVKLEPGLVKEEATALVTGPLKTEEHTTPAHVSQTIKLEPTEHDQLQHNLNTTEDEDTPATSTYEDTPATSTYESTLHMHTTTHRTRVNTKLSVASPGNGPLNGHTTRCGNKTIKSNSLKASTRTGGTGRHICPTCNKSLADLSSLRKHVTSHGVGQPYTCDDCGRTFYHRTYMISHLRTHSEHKPFACPTCGKVFGQLGHLRTHQLRHLGTRAFYCDICVKSFTVRASLNKHVRSKLHKELSLLPKSERGGRGRGGARGHVTGAAVPCAHCGETFSTAGNMKRHVQRKHSS